MIKRNYFEPFIPNRVTKLKTYWDRLRGMGMITEDRKYLLNLCKNCGYPRGEHFSPDCPGTTSIKWGLRSLPNYPPEINVNLKLNINTRIL